ncbi:MAG: tRNA (adenosine(37)-N6)-dimethylallyltransferase MiaA [Silicimonas sp.]|nr:tRNA (adenosine(37)-N6)-dimethylallyltransferase MiaA [Silicimonas sp.]
MSEKTGRFNASEAGIIDKLVETLSTDRPVLIAGPTASGKSALAMAIARRSGGPIVNADALQVYGDWRVLTARPSPADEAALPHRLYGHIPGDRAYSVGDWLRDVAPLLLDGPPPVIVGGTGLYFTALTEGLADIPVTPDSVRAEALDRLADEGAVALLAELDAETARRIDQSNPMRVQRAWEVLRTTGRGLAAWQDDTGPPLLPLETVQALLIDAPKDWLTPRIEARFDQMLLQGALDEARRNAPGWHPGLPSAKAIGAAELVAHVRGEMPLEAARDAAITLTRQYAKRQRSWFRARMKNWRHVPAPDAIPTQNR